MNSSKRYSINEPLTRLHTNDAARKTGDTVITAVPLGSSELDSFTSRTGPLIGLNLGTLWTGDLKPTGMAMAGALDALRKIRDPRKARDALVMAQTELSKFGGELERSEASGTPVAGALSFNADEKLDGDEVDVTGHKVAKAAMGDSGGAQLRTWRDHASAVVDNINARNKKFWHQK